VRRAMTQRATRPVTLATLTRVKVARLCRRCDIGLTEPMTLTLHAVLVSDRADDLVSDVAVCVEHVARTVVDVFEAVWT